MDDFVNGFAPYFVQAIAEDLFADLVQMDEFLLTVELIDSFPDGAQDGLETRDAQKLFESKGRPRGIVSICPQEKGQKQNGLDDESHDHESAASSHTSRVLCVHGLHQIGLASLQASQGVAYPRVQTAPVGIIPQEFLRPRETVRSSYCNSSIQVSKLLMGKTSQLDYRSCLALIRSGHCLQGFEQRFGIMAGNAKFNQIGIIAR